MFCECDSKIQLKKEYFRKKKYLLKDLILAFMLFGKWKKNKKALNSNQVTISSAQILCTNTWVYHEWERLCSLRHCLFLTSHVCINQVKRWDRTFMQNSPKTGYAYILKEHIRHRQHRILQMIIAQVWHNWQSYPQSLQISEKEINDPFLIQKLFEQVTQV